jgi:hypothetical protein
MLEEDWLSGKFTKSVPKPSRSDDRLGASVKMDNRILEL